MKNSNEKFVSTTDASILLNLSVATVQKMVDEETLKAWKTAGGHRRVQLDSIYEFLNKKEISTSNSPIVIYIVEDDVVTSNLYINVFKTWKFPIETVIFSSGIECVHQLTKQIPNLIITDLKMKNMDGFELINFIKSKPEYKNIFIIVVTSMKIDQVENSLPKNITLLEKPIPFAELKGFVNALIRMKYEE